MTSRFVFWVIGLLMFTAAATVWLPASVGFLSAVTLALVWCQGLERAADRQAGLSSLHAVAPHVHAAGPDHARRARE